MQSSAQYGLLGHPQLIESSSVHPIVSAGLRAMEMQSITLHTKLFSSAGGNYFRLTRYVWSARNSSWRNDASVHGIEFSWMRDE
jgi:hypothetical protein